MAKIRVRDNNGVREVSIDGAPFKPATENQKKYIDNNPKYSEGLDTLAVSKAGAPTISGGTLDPVGEKKLTWQDISEYVFRSEHLEPGAAADMPKAKTGAYARIMANNLARDPRVAMAFAVKGGADPDHVLVRGNEVYILNPDSGRYRAIDPRGMNSIKEAMADIFLDNWDDIGRTVVSIASGLGGAALFAPAGPAGAIAGFGAGSAAGDFIVNTALQDIGIRLSGVKEDVAVQWGDAAFEASLAAVPEAAQLGLRGVKLAYQKAAAPALNHIATQAARSKTGKKLAAGADKLVNTEGVSITANMAGVPENRGFQLSSPTAAATPSSAATGVVDMATQNQASYDVLSKTFKAGEELSGNEASVRAAADRMAGKTKAPEGMNVPEGHLTGSATDFSNSLYEVTRSKAPAGKEAGIIADSIVDSMGNKPALAKDGLYKVLQDLRNTVSGVKNNSARKSAKRDLDNFTETLLNIATPEQMDIALKQAGLSESGGIPTRLTSGRGQQGNKIDLSPPPYSNPRSSFGTPEYRMGSEGFTDIYPYGGTGTDPFLTGPQRPPLAGTGKTREIIYEEITPREAITRSDKAMQALLNQFDTGQGDKVKRFFGEEGMFSAASAKSATRDEARGAATSGKMFSKAYGKVRVLLEDAINPYNKEYARLNELAHRQNTAISRVRKIVGDNVDKAESTLAGNLFGRTGTSSLNALAFLDSTLGTNFAEQAVDIKRFYAFPEIGGVPSSKMILAATGGPRAEAAAGAGGGLFSKFAKPFSISAGLAGGGQLIPGTAGNIVSGVGLAGMAGVGAYSTLGAFKYLRSPKATIQTFGKVSDATRRMTDIAMGASPVQFFGTEASHKLGVGRTLNALDRRAAAMRTGRVGSVGFQGARLQSKEQFDLAKRRSQGYMSAWDLLNMDTNQR